MNLKTFFSAIGFFLLTSQSFAQDVTHRVYVAAVPGSGPGAVATEAECSSAVFTEVAKDVPTGNYIVNYNSPLITSLPDGEYRFCVRLSSQVAGLAPVEKYTIAAPENANPIENNIVSLTRLPTPVIGSTIYSYNPEKIDVSWSSVNEASAYMIERSLSSDFSVSSAFEVTTNSFSDTDVGLFTEIETVFYRIRAKNSSSERLSPWSASSSVVTTLPPPTGLVVVPVSDGTGELSFTPAVQNVDQLVERSVGGGSFAVLGSSGTSPFTDNTLEHGQTYTYRVYTSWPQGSGSPKKSIDFSETTYYYPNNCGSTQHGDTAERTRFLTETVPYGSTCVSEIQEASCTDGTLSAYSGTFSFSACEVLPDAIAPTPGAFSASTDVESSSFTLNWSAASDNATATASIEYLLCSGPTIADIDSVSECEGSTVEMNYSAGILTQNITGKDPSTTYYYNVLAKDEAGNKAVYETFTQTTAVDVTVTISYPAGSQSLSYLESFAIPVSGTCSIIGSTISFSAEEGDVSPRSVTSSKSFTCGSDNQYSGSIVIRDLKNGPIDLKAFMSDASLTVPAESSETTVIRNDGSIVDMKVTTLSGAERYSTSASTNMRTANIMGKNVIDLGDGYKATKVLSNRVFITDGTTANSRFLYRGTIDFTLDGQNEMVKMGRYGYTCSNSDMIRFSPYASEAFSNYNASNYFSICMGIVVGEQKDRVYFMMWSTTANAGKVYYFEEGSAAPVALNITTPLTSAMTILGEINQGGVRRIILQDATLMYSYNLASEPTGGALTTLTVSGYSPNPTNERLDSYIVKDGLLYFVSQTGTLGDGKRGQPWVTDGTVAGTRVIKVINATGDMYSGTVPSTKNVGPDGFFQLGSKLYFLATPNGTTSGVYETDGTSTGTVLRASFLNAGSPTNILSSAPLVSLTTEGDGTSVLIYSPTTGTNTFHFDSLNNTLTTVASGIFMADFTYCNGNYFMSGSASVSRLESNLTRVALSPPLTSTTTGSNSQIFCVDSVNKMVTPAFDSGTSGPQSMYLLNVVSGAFTRSLLASQAIPIPASGDRFLADEERVYLAKLRSSSQINYYSVDTLTSNYSDNGLPATKLLGPLSATGVSVGIKFLNLNDEIFFNAAGRYYKTDGTVDGTVQPVGSALYYPRSFTKIKKSPTSSIDTSFVLEATSGSDAVTTPIAFDGYTRTSTPSMNTTGPLSSMSPIFSKNNVALIQSTWSTGSSFYRMTANDATYTNTLIALPGTITGIIPIQRNASQRNTAYMSSILGNDVYAVCDVVGQSQQRRLCRINNALGSAAMTSEYLGTYFIVLPTGASLIGILPYSSTSSSLTHITYFVEETANLRIKRILANGNSDTLCSSIAGSSLATGDIIRMSATSVIFRTAGTSPGVYSLDLASCGSPTLLHSSAFAANTVQLFHLDDKVYFISNARLFETDGTTIGTRQLYTFDASAGVSLSITDGKVYAYDGERDIVYSYQP